MFIGVATVTLGVFVNSLAGFAFYLMKRASSPLPPHAEFAQMVNPPEDSQ